LFPRGGHDHDSVVGLEAGEEERVESTMSLEKMEASRTRTS
jgi:hypothetical protein